MQRCQVPLWVGEFGANSSTGLEDQLSVFEEFGVHWTIWTYKDVGVMGFVQVDPASPYVQVLAPVLKAKQKLGVDTWLSAGLPGTEVGETIDELASQIERELADPTLDEAANRRFLAQTALGGYTASLMQPHYARRFQGMGETELDQVLQSFALKNCRPREEILAVLKKYWA
jgi:hypothetical protein